MTSRTFIMSPLWALCLGIISQLSAWGNGQEVVVVYNSAVPASKQVAEYYAKARQVPPDHLFGFNLTPDQDMSRSSFHADLQVPLAEGLEQRGLWHMGKVEVPYLDGVPKHVNHVVVSTSIRYVVLCYGVPVRISEDSTLQEAIPQDYPAGFRVNRASVDSELVWLPLIKLSARLTGPWVNWVYGVTNQTGLNPTNGILLVSRLDGPTPEIACGLVDKALQAEHDGLWGRAYCDARGLDKSSSYYYGDQMMEESAVVCRKLGFETALDTNAATFSTAYPMSNIALYCGWYDENVSGPFTLPNVEFMPGAIAYHLHSYSAGNLRNPNKNWVGPLLAKGVTCTMGCVNEPYLMLTPDIHTFLLALAHGWTFAEAGWAAQPVLSWQTTLVGDPLYTPFARNPVEWFRDLQARQSPLVDWAFLRLMDLDLVRAAPLDHVQNVIEKWPGTSHNPVLSQKLAELNMAQGTPEAAVNYYQRALDLKPSRQQRIEIRLALGPLLVSQKRLPEAVKNDQALLAEVPDYPGQAAIAADLKQLSLQLASPAAGPHP